MQLKKKKKDFYELWQQHKQLKTMEMSEAWPDTYDEGYIIPTWTDSQISPGAAEALSLEKILPLNISQMITKTIPISRRVVISYVMKRNIPLWIWRKVMETETKTWSKFRNGGKAIVEQILVSKERNQLSKRAGLWQSQSGIRVGKLTIWLMLFEIEKL